MQMIFPAARETSGRTPRRLNSRTASRAHRNWPVRLTPITVFHCCSVIRSSGASRCRPALATTMSTVPNSCSVRANIAWTCSSWLTSARTQGNRVNIRSRGLPNEAFEVGGVPAGALAAVLEAHGRSRLMQQVHRHVPDHGHVRGAVAGPEPGEIIAEDDIQDPVQPVLDAPVGPYRAGEARRVEGGGGEIVAPFPLDLAAALGGALDHADHGEAGKGDLAGAAPA